MNVFLWNARGGNVHVEATLNHPFPAQVDDDHIDDLARVLLAAAQDPLNAHALKAENASLQHKLMSMRERIDNLEEALHQASVRKTERGGTMFKSRRDSPPPHL